VGLDKRLFILYLCSRKGNVCGDAGLDWTQRSCVPTNITFFKLDLLNTLNQRNFSNELVKHFEGLFPLSLVRFFTERPNDGKHCAKRGASFRAVCPEGRLYRHYEQPAGVRLTLIQGGAGRDAYAGCFRH
jgi:hypothetical protein